MGIEEEIIQSVSTGTVGFTALPDYFWYIFLIICPGYIVGLLIFYSRYQTVDSWFDKSPFDKTIISILFGGLFVILVSIGAKVFFFVKGVQIFLNPETLSIIISILAGMITIITTFRARKRSDEEKRSRILKYEYEKMYKEFPMSVREDFIIEKVAKILGRYSKDYIWGAEGDPDFAIPDLNNPKVCIEIKAIPTKGAIRATFNKMKYLKDKFPDSKFVLIVSLPHWFPTSIVQKEFISQFDAVFDFFKIDDFEEYIKEQLEIKE